MNKCNSRDDNSCLWSDNGAFCAMLERASVPLDRSWPLIILILRGIKEFPTLSEAQKSLMQELLFVVLQQKDFSERRLEEVHKRAYDIIVSPYAHKLDEVARETSALAKDIYMMFGRHTKSIADTARLLDGGLSKNMSPVNLLADVRDTIRGIVAQMEKDASTLITLSHKDSLTGLANRRAFDHFLEEASERWILANSPTSVILFDIDKFKSVNDTFGHLVGDQVLKSIGGQIHKVASSLSNENSNVLAARFGGEEFALVLCGDIVARTMAIADNLRKTIQKTEILLRDANDMEVPSDLRVTVSVGVAEMWEGWKGAHMENLVNYADKALYHAKNSGRNCTALFIPEPEEQFVVVAQG